MLPTLNYIRYISVLVAWSGIYANAAAPSYNLVVGDGGYARLLESPPPLSDLTLTAWVNITEFPLGVAPIFTAVAPGAANQVAFFLRHDGLGVLWGGPQPVARRSSHAYVDRQPRQWATNQRKKRDVDYSIGLGDVVDVLSKRSSRGNDHWSSLSFTDIEDMGVSDLDTSETIINKEMHFLPTRSLYSRSESYNDWHNVPYELDMQESDVFEHEIREPAPRIITEPNGDDDDFVFINWNSPNPLTKTQVPESPNQWSPINVPPKDLHLSSNTQIKINESPKEESGDWSSEVTEVKLIPDIWKTFAIKQDGSSVSIDEFSKPGESVIYPQRITTKGVPATERPSTTTTTRRTTTQKPPTRRATTQKPPTRRTTTQKPLTRRTTPQKTTRQPSSTKHILKSTSSKPKLTTPKPTQYTTNRFTAPPTTPYAKRKSSTRMPLWKLINRPNSSERKSTSKPSVQRSTTRQTLPKQQTSTSRFTTRRTSNKQQASTARYTTRRTFNKHQTTTIPTTKEQQTTTTRPTTKVKPELSVVTRPNISGHKSKVSIYSSAEEKWEEKPQVNQNYIYKHNPREVHEFEKKVMKIPNLVKEGDTAVVYSIPITNEEEFNSMYRQYQQQAKPTSTPKQMVRVTPQSHMEEEKNENSIMETTPSMSQYQNIQTYKNQNGNGDPFKKTVSPAVYSEKDAVLSPTEEPLSPTPARTSAPKRKASVSYKPTYTPKYSTNNFQNENTGNQGLILENAYKLELTNATSEKDRLLEREGLQRKTSPNPFEKELEIVYQENEKLSPIPIAGHKQLADVAAFTKLNYALPELVKSSEDLGISLHSIPSQPLHHTEENLYNKLDNHYKPDVQLSPHKKVLPVSRFQISESLYPRVQTQDQKDKSVIYSADPADLLAQGLLPRPVHYVSTPEEANRWMKEKQETSSPSITPAQDRVAIVDNDQSFNSFSASLKDDVKSSTQWLPAQQASTQHTLPIKQPQPQNQAQPQIQAQPQNQETQIPEDQPMNVHFRKLPYNFLSNHWYHIAFTWSSTTHTVGVYINGNLVGNLKGAMPLWNNIPGDGLTILGQTLLPDLTDFDPTSRFQGLMNEVNLYGNTLSPNQIKNIYNCSGNQNLSKKVTWHQLSMRFYSDIHTEPTSSICGISV